jgi:hypothetical protein
MYQTFAAYMPIRKYTLLLILSLFVVQIASGQKYYFKRIQENHKWGLKGFGSSGKIVLPCEYDRLDNWQNGYAILGKAGKYGMIDSNARIVVPLKYTEMREFHSGLARIKDENNKFGFITPMARIAIEPVYDSASEFYEKESGNDITTISVAINGNLGLITNEGKTVIPPEMDFIGEFKDGMALCKKDGKFGYIGTDGQWIVQPQFMKVTAFDKGKAQASPDGQKWGLINEKGIYILQPEYDEIKEYVEGMAQLRQADKWGFVNMSGQVAVKPQFAEENNYVEGFALVKYFEKSYKDKPGPTYKDVLPKAKIAEPGWGFVDKIGTLVTGPFFQEAHNFKNGIALVTLKGGVSGYINRRGEFKKN